MTRYEDFNFDTIFYNTKYCGIDINILPSNMMLTRCTKAYSSSCLQTVSLSPATPLFDLFSQNSHFPLSLDMRIWYCWKAYLIRIPAVQTVSKYV